MTRPTYFELECALRALAYSVENRSGSMDEMRAAWASPLLQIRRMLARCGSSADWTSPDIADYARMATRREINWVQHLTADAMRDSIDAIGARHVYPPADVDRCVQYEIDALIIEAYSNERKRQND